MPPLGVARAASRCSRRTGPPASSVVPRMSGACDAIASANRLIGRHLRAGRLDAAREVFDGMPSRDVVSWNSLMAAHARLDNYSGHEHLTASVQPGKYSEDTFKMKLVKNSKTPSEVLGRLQVLGCEELGGLSDPDELAGFEGSWKGNAGHHLPGWNQNASASNSDNSGTAVDADCHRLLRRRLPTATVTSAAARKTPRFPPKSYPKPKPSVQLLSVPNSQPCRRSCAASLRASSARAAAARFTRARRQTRACWRAASRLASHTVVRFAGPEAARFLHSLLTNDLLSAFAAGGASSPQQYAPTPNAPARGPAYSALLTPQGWFLYDLYRPPPRSQMLDRTG
ncbi:hypothetical protein C2845_PM10G01840 [Panicum miliaceum]|uniref:Pentatricopeptide repeat-containing protein n=1 Tax=Panicum miliaceum TaxID=4540 RepID=A0A3L6PFK5_PANMI|nr:hypothetical protein C2845_PM10G01840 [Panicum miliaceum]